MTPYFSPSIDFLISVIFTFQNSFLLFLDCLFYSLIKKKTVGNSLAVQWLRIHTLAAGPGLIPKPQLRQKKKKKNQSILICAIVSSKNSEILLKVLFSFEL